MIRDLCTKPAAEALARKIRTYWLMNGQLPTVWAEKSHGEGEGEIWVVRSNLKWVVPHAQSVQE